MVRGAGAGGSFIACLMDGMIDADAPVVPRQPPGLGTASAGQTAGPKAGRPVQIAVSPEAPAFEFSSPFLSKWPLAHGPARLARTGACQGVPNSAADLWVSFEVFTAIFDMHF